jgi:hypothetical protein
VTRESELQSTSEEAAGPTASEPPSQPEGLRLSLSTPRLRATTPSNTLAATVAVLFAACGGSRNQRLGYTAVGATQ